MVGCSTLMRRQSSAWVNPSCSNSITSGAELSKCYPQIHKGILEAALMCRLRSAIW